MPKMNVNVKYLGMLAEVTGCDEETFRSAETSVNDFLETLFGKYPNLREKSFKVAQNQTIVSKEVKLSGEEIALLPPFSGG